MTVKEQINVELEKLNYLGLEKALEQVRLITLIPAMQRSKPIQKQPQFPERPPFMDGKMLRSLRKEKKLTQAELANLTGVSVMTIRRYESMDRIPRIDIVIKLMDVLKADSDNNRGC